MIKQKSKKLLGKKAKSPEPDVLEEVNPHLVAIIDALRDFVALLDEETAMASSGKIPELANFLQKKKDMDLRLKKVTRAAADNGYHLIPGSSDGARVESELAKLREASVVNAEALQGAKNALDHVHDLMKKASSERGSEGMYGRNASKVAAPDKKMLGFEAQI